MACRGWGHRGFQAGPRADTVWILWLRDPTQTAKADNTAAARGGNSFRGGRRGGRGAWLERRGGGSANQRLAAGGFKVLRAARPRSPAGSAWALELLRRFPARARVTLRGLLLKPTS